MSTIKELLTKLVERTKQAIIDDTDVVPLAFFIKDGHVLDMAMFDLGETPRDKVNVWMMIATRAALEKCDGVILIVDAYMTIIPNSEWEGKPDYKFTPPSKDPNRIQAVVISYLADDRKDQTITIPYDRNNMGSHVKEEQVDWTEETTIEGTQGDIFHNAFELPEADLRVAGALLQTLVHNSKLDLATGELHEASQPFFPPAEDQSDKSDGNVN